MKYAIAISILNSKLRNLRLSQKETASTESKIIYANTISAIEKAIKAVKQHDEMLDLLKRLDKWADSSLSSVSQEAWMKEQDTLFEQIKKVIEKAKGE
jgi:hypothetical protein